MNLHAGSMLRYCSARQSADWCLGNVKQHVCSVLGVMSCEACVHYNRQLVRHDASGYMCICCMADVINTSWQQASLCCTASDNGTMFAATLSCCGAARVHALVYVRGNCASGPWRRCRLGGVSAFGCYGCSVTPAA
jgi:hypothetical protein